MFELIATLPLSVISPDMSKPETRPKHMKTDNPCIRLSRQTAAGHEPIEFLRVEPNPGCFYLFSYHHIDLAKFESGKEKEILTITFFNHRVRIEGKNLRMLAVELQSRWIEMARPLPHRYGAAFGQDVYQIEVIEVGRKRQCSVIHS